MRSRRGIRLSPWLGVACLVAAPGFTTVVRAQPGYGPDPFWPYNSQYTPYTTPIGPAEPKAGQGLPRMPRSGLAGANQFQDYLNTLGGAAAVGGGAGRSTTTDRSSVGMPYFRSTVDPAFEQTYKREYRPNQEADRAFERRQELVTDQYLAYFAEPDPRKRASLLKQYRQTRRATAGALGSRRESPTRLLESATRLGSELGLSTRREDERGRASFRPQPPSGGAGAPARTGASSPLRPGSMSSTPGLGSGSRAGLPPSLAPPGRSRVGGRFSRTPSEILDRARALDDPIVPAPGSLAPRATRRRTDRRPVPPPPPVNPD